jgi:hypothetical protein
MVKAQNIEFNVSSHPAIALTWVPLDRLSNSRKTEAGRVRVQSKINKEAIMQRFDYGKVAPGTYRAMLGLERHLHEGHVKIRPDFRPQSATSL